MITTKPLSQISIDSAASLSRDAGWNQLPSDWERLVQHEPDGCFAACHGANLVGTVTTTRFEKKLGWIGMMLVHRSHRRQGIATRLMRLAIDYLVEKGVAHIFLDATPDGLPLYNQFGFRSLWNFHRWCKDQDLYDADVKNVENGELDAKCYQLDTEAFGTARTDFLKRLGADSYVLRNGRSFGMSRPGFLADYIGPIVAESAVEAETIVDALLQKCRRGVFWDVPSPNLAAVEIARKFSFRPVRDLTRMILSLNEADFECNIQLQYALADPATG